jgi:diguanylate cyclase (GGDEF)-like protein
MNTIQIVVISLKSAFPDYLRENLKTSASSLPPYQVNHISSLKEELPEDLIGSSRVVLIDLDNLPDDREIVLNEIVNIFPDLSLVLVTKGDQPEISSSFPVEHSPYLINQIDISSPLFPSFLLALITQSELARTTLTVQEDLDNRENDLLFLRKASLHLTLNLSLDAVLEAILESALELISADDTHIFFYDHGVLSFGAALFNGHKQNKPFMNPRPHGATYQVAREGTMLVSDNVLTDPLFADIAWDGAIISLPLKIGNKVLGVMNAALHRPHQFTENEIRGLEFLGDQASLAIQNAKLYEKSQKEIADRKKAEKVIKHLANHDSLTGLPNRRLFNERIKLEISRAQRNDQKICIMLFDLDHLKKVNDSYGHHIGDLLFQAVAQRLLGLLRKSDTVARVGGDEFLLILPEMLQKEGAILTAGRILDTLSTPFHIESHEVSISTSIGIVFYPDDGDDVNDLVKKADIAMYKAKEKGRNVYHVYTA